MNDLFLKPGYPARAMGSQNLGCWIEVMVMGNNYDVVRGPHGIETKLHQPSAMTPDTRQYTYIKETTSTRDKLSKV